MSQDPNTLELLVKAPDNTTKTLRLRGPAVSLGRARKNALCYPEDASLSREHCVFELEEQTWWIRDLKSKNHTFVNGNRIDKVKLQDGDQITAGRLTMVYGDATQQPSGSVEFYPDSHSETPPLATVMTNLGGVLSGEISQPTPSQPMRRADSGDSSGTFRSPVVTALIRAGKELMSNRPLDELFDMILKLSIETVGAERGLLLTLEGDELLPRAQRGEGFRISSGVRDKVLQERASLLVHDAQQDQAFKDRMSIIDQQIRTMMAVPLQTDERVIGLIYVDSRFVVRDFTADDLSLLTVLANVAAIRIEHQRLAEVERAERLLKIELDQAAAVQQQLLPASAPQVPGLDIAGHNAACRTVGGDYYDFLEYPDQSVGIVLGDVAGKGMPASLLMVSLQAQVQVLAWARESISDLVSRLDRGISANCPRNRFITLFFGVLDASGELRYCNAGHNPPLVIRADGTTEELPVGGTVLGILPDLGYEERSCRLGPGDLIAVFSDGITEAADPADEEFGEERLAKLLHKHRDEPAEQIIEIINDAVREWSQGAPAADDMTLVVARRTA